MKGIILAGGQATRIRPITDVVSKQLLPVFDKPMIYYPLSVLMLAGIREILVITSPKYKNQIAELLGDGTRFGIKLEYRVQEKANGLAEAFIIGEDFVNDAPCALVLGDNILWGDDLKSQLNKAVNNLQLGYATVFGRRVKKPENFGVAAYNKRSGIVTELVEKSSKPPTNEAVIGLYFYGKGVCDIAKKIKPSERGELEITDLNNEYVKEKKLKLIPLEEEEFEWFDGGAFDELLVASQQVSKKQRPERMIGSPDVIAFENGWIDKAILSASAEVYKKSDYGKNLKKTVAGKKKTNVKATEKKQLDDLDLFNNTGKL